MAKNYMRFSEDIRIEMERGLPNGLDNMFSRKLPFLMKRLDELERALAPFARLYDISRNDNQELIYAYKKDCQQAFNVLSLHNAYDVPKKLPEFPAE